MRRYGKKTNLTGGFFFARLMESQEENKFSDKKLAALINKEFEYASCNVTRVRLYRHRYNKGVLNSGIKPPKKLIQRYDEKGEISEPGFGPKPIYA